MVAGKIRDYIDSHLGDNHLEDEFSLDKIARELNYSKFYMERVFSEVIGTTIYKYISIIIVQNTIYQQYYYNISIPDTQEKTYFNKAKNFNFL